MNSSNTISIIRTRHGSAAPGERLPRAVDYLFEVGGEGEQPALLIPLRVTREAAHTVLGDGLPDYPLAAWSALLELLQAAAAVAETRLAQARESSRAGGRPCMTSSASLPFDPSRDLRRTAAA